MARKSRKHLIDSPSKQAPKRYAAGIYARVSSDEQNRDSIENQETICRQYMESDSKIQLFKVYVDYGVSSFAQFRPGFNEMLLDIESKTINCIIVKDISRFSREYIQACYFIQKKFPLCGIRFIAVNDSFDSLHDDTTKIEVALRSLLYYRCSVDLSGKIQSSIEVRQKTGDYIPAKLPYGYIKKQAEHGIEWRLNENAAIVVRDIFTNALNGVSAYGIAGDLNRRCINAPNSAYWTSGSVLRILRNVSYTGAFITGKTRNNRTANFRTESIPKEEWIKHYGHHIPIIDEITYYSVQRILAKRKSSYTNHKNIVDFFGGKLYCGICGRKMRPKRSTNGNTYYICPRKDEAAASCVNKAKSEHKLKIQVFHALQIKTEEMKKRRQEMIAYTNSPYYRRMICEQKRKIQSLWQELERQNGILQSQYEYSITKHLIIR